MTDAGRRVEHVTCLGCGCACDDIGVTTADGLIIALDRACELGRRWFGDGSTPARTTIDGRPSSAAEAIAAAARLLTGARGRLLVYLAPDATTEAMREALALADRLRAVVDTATSDPAADAILAAQRRGRAAATLGELRNRGDLIVFWGVDPAARYPRFFERYGLDPVGTHLPNGRASRTAIGVSIGAAKGPAGMDISLTFGADEETAALGVMRATLAGAALGPLPPALQPAAELAARLTKGRYVVLVSDAEPGTAAPDGSRAEALIALTQRLNDATRAALITLRAGGNCSGAEAALTWQTGYPLAVDYVSGAPRYRPEWRAAARLAAGTVGAVLVVGAAAGVPEAVCAALAAVPVAVIGPRASEAPFRTAVAIDTGTAGIHETGTAYRMDDVPLPLTPPLDTPRALAATLRLVAAELGAAEARG